MNRTGGITRRTARTARKRTLRSRGLRLALSVSLLACALPAQIIQLGGRRAAASEKDDGRDGPKLVLPESEDLNRVLRRVTEFFAQDPPKWDEGVKMLQDLLEGRVLEAVDDRANDPFFSVYSQDERLYVPFARYCQRLVCSLPPEGLEAYRFLTDGRASREFAEAAETLDAPRLERLSELFFASSSGPDILMLLADVATLRGQLSRAIYLRSRLLEEYPDLDAGRQRSCLVRQAHAHAVLGESAARQRILEQLAQLGGQPVPLAGAEVPIKELEGHAAFAVRDTGARTEIIDAARGIGSGKLDRLWRFTFASPDPYGLRTKKTGSGSRHMVFFGGQRFWEMPSRKSQRPGLSTVTWREGRRRMLAFKDHDRVVLLEAVGGRVVRQLGGTAKFSSVVKSNQLALRMPTTDFGMQMIRRIGRRLYCTVDNLKPASQSNSTNFPYRNKLIALDLDTGEELWRTVVAAGAKRVYFRGPPVEYRGMLYAPARQHRSFGIAKVDAATGEVKGFVEVHDGGTRFLRVPSVPLVRVGTQLIATTNAGAVAAYSLPDLELRWLRAYETRTKHMPEPRRRTTRRNNYWGVREVPMKRWKPVEPIVTGGKIVVAPTDSDALICLDTNSGRLLWILPRKEKRGSDFQEVVGHDGKRLYIAGDRLQCIDLEGGKRLWERDLSQLPEGKPEGNGAVAGGYVYLPGKSVVYRFDGKDGELRDTLYYPKPAPGTEIWEYPARLEFAGSLLLAVRECGIESFTVPDDFVADAGGAVDRAERAAAIGRLGVAVKELAEGLGSGKLPIDERPAVQKLYVRYVGEHARAQKDKAKALAVVDEAEALFRKIKVAPDPRLLIFRIDVLDPKADAKEIRQLREKIADLGSDVIGATDSSR